MKFRLRGDLSDCKNLQQLKQFIKYECKGELEVFSREELAVDTCFGLWPCVLFCSSFRLKRVTPQTQLIQVSEVLFTFIPLIYLLLSSQAARNHSLWNWQASRPFKNHSPHYQLARETIKNHYSFSHERPWWRMRPFGWNLPKWYRIQVFIPWVKNITIIGFNTAALKSAVKHQIYWQINTALLRTGQMLADILCIGLELCERLGRVLGFLTKVLIKQG